MNLSSILSAQKLIIPLGPKRCSNSLDLNLAPGEIWGLLGENGSGKTSLLETLAGLRQPKEGQIFLDQQALASYSRKARAQQIGLLFQDYPRGFPQTVRDYCLAGRYPHSTSYHVSPEDQDLSEQALAQFELLDKQKQCLTTLSGGEWRRLNLATLITQNPRLYLLDEPLNHLDQRHQHQVLQLFQQKARTQKISVLMALHDIKMAELYCDQLIFLEGTVNANSNYSQWSLRTHGASHG